MATYHPATKPEDFYPMDFDCLDCDWRGKGAAAIIASEDVVRCPLCRNPVVTRQVFRSLTSAQRDAVKDGRSLAEKWGWPGTVLVWFIAAVGTALVPVWFWLMWQSVAVAG